MRNTKHQFTPIERLMVLMILLVLAAVAIQNLANSLKESEEHSVKAATVEYAGVRSMYAAQNHAVTFGDAGLGSTIASGVASMSSH